MCSDLPDGSTQTASSSRQVRLESLGLLDFLRLFSLSNYSVNQITKIIQTDLRSENAQTIVQVQRGL